MRLGKTAQAITAADLIGAERILVICPAVARINWMREFTHFSQYQRKLCVVDSSTSIPATWKKGVLICSYEWASHHTATLPAGFDLLIIDEAHYCKNPEALRAQTVLGILSHRATRTWALTGTPAPNNASELWPLLFTFGVTPLSHANFITQHCVTRAEVMTAEEMSKLSPKARIGARETIIGTRDPLAVRILVKDVMKRRTAKEVMPQMPPIVFSEFVVEPGEVDLESHFADRDAVKELHIVRKEIEQQSALIKAIGGMTDYNKRLGALEGLVGSTSTLRRYMGIQKCAPLSELVLGEMDEGAYDKIVIFCMHRAVIGELRSRLKKYNPVTLYGGTSPAAKQKNIDRFQDPKSGCGIFLGQIAAAGTAIGLHAANQVLFAEYDWVPGNNAQAAVRTHGIKQDRPVFVRFAVAAGVIDEIVLKVVRRKTKELATIFDPIDIFG